MHKNRKKCGVAPESTKPEDKLLNVIVYFMFP